MQRYIRVLHSFPRSARDRIEMRVPCVYYVGTMWVLCGYYTERGQLSGRQGGRAGGRTNVYCALQGPTPSSRRSGLPSRRLPLLRRRLLLRLLRVRRPQRGLPRVDALRLFLKVLKHSLHAAAVRVGAGASLQVERAAWAVPEMLLGSTAGAAPCPTRLPTPAEGPCNTRGRRGGATQGAGGAAHLQLPGSQLAQQAAQRGREVHCRLQLLQKEAGEPGREEEAGGLG